MFQVALFLRNHSRLHRWDQLNDSVKRLFPAPAGPQAWAEFYIADPGQRRYCFEFIVSGSGRLRRYRADVVMLQESCGLLTLITYPHKKGRMPASVSLSVGTIEAAVFIEDCAKKRRLT
jgi:hypothetical protein